MTECYFLNTYDNSLILSLFVPQSSDGTLGAVIDDVLDLKLVLVVGVMLGQVSELLSQVETVLGEFWTHKVLGDLDAVVEIPHLVTS